MYGSTPEVMANMWSDLLRSDIPNAICTEDNKSLDGFRHFLMAHCFLWGYPRNFTWLRVMFFPIGEKESQGERFWRWVFKIQSLLPSTIKWMDRWDDPDDPNCEIFIIGVDGTDCKTWEPKHPTFPVDPKSMSHKFKHGGLKHEIAVAIYEDRIVWVNGPFPAGRHDMTIFREDGLKKRMPEDKMAVLDRGCRTSRKDEAHRLATPMIGDDAELHIFMSRVRCRTETVMGRLKEFKCLSETFRHGVEKHEWCFKAVAVIVQYQMDHGNYLYEV